MDRATADGSRSADDASLASLLERLGRDSGGLALAVAVAERHRLSRGAAAATVAAACALCLVAAFVFANVAALEALWATLSGWRAPLVLAGAWTLAAAAVAAPFVGSSRRAAVAGRRETVAEAEQRLRATVDDLGGAVTRQVEERLASALLSATGGIVHAGEEVVDTVDELIEVADELTDVVEERLPGGVIVNRAVDVVLVPGRLGVRVVRRVFELGRPVDWQPPR